MKRPHRVPEAMQAAQRLAASPDVSAWVSANAGAGKTHVLSRRVIRLLLDGTDPARILCLTYTRAAAAEMSNRVFRDLGRWAMMGDSELSDEIVKLDGGEKPDAALLSRARRLFARALETPGGLKIQTIHAFCEAVLHQFPLEANIAGRFELADQSVTDALLAQARREVLTAAAVSADTRLAAALEDVLAWGGEAGLEKLLDETIGKRDALRSFTSQFKDGDARSILLSEFGFGENDTASSVSGSVWPLPGFDAKYLETVAEFAATNNANRMRSHFTEPAAEAFSQDDPEICLSKLANAFFGSGGEPYSPDWLFPKAAHSHFPDLSGRYLEAAAHIGNVIDRLNLFRMIGATASALTLADALIGRYRHLKTARGLLDFNDLIVRTVHLLSRREAGPWVQYKLDRGIDHILVDEAQDTSPAQWDVIRMLASEFFAGEGARGEVLRTIFAVGDEKQSIYSFQGAEPEAFSLSRYDFLNRAIEAGRRFERVELKHSFRSVADILAAVDLVFADAESRQGLTLYDEDIAHIAIRESEPGFVEIWDSIGEEQIDEPEDWREPVDHARAAAVKLANAIAVKIVSWLNGEAAPNGARNLTPGDIIVLVRKRDRFMHALSRALKDRQIAVAGADRIRLRDHIAVKDMMALGRVVLQAEDELSLAALMKSPVFGLDDDALIELGSTRPPGASLLDRVSDHPVHDHIAARISAWRAMASRLPVFDFYARLLGREGIRRAMVSRLGNEAGDILDEFLNFALACEKAGITGLEAFLATLDAEGPEIRRESGTGRDEIRIMTVHAAKGLEARCVFLVDSGGKPVSDSHLPRLLPVRSQSGKWLGPGFLWYPAKQLKNTVSELVRGDLTRKAGEEYRRLLYVGMTRAEDGLVLCGYHGKQNRHPQTWHSMVARALEGSSERLEDRVTGLTVSRYAVTPVTALIAKSEQPQSREDKSSVPDFLTRPAAPAPTLPRPLSPSGVSAVIETETEYRGLTVSPVLGADAEPSVAQQRGTAIHRLLQKLPDMQQHQWHDAARRFVSYALPGLAKAEVDALVDSVIAVLADPAFTPIFATGSRAEVSVMGTLTLAGRQHAVSGKMDRVAVTGDDVLIVDYKTNRPAPRNLDEIPGAYIAQMALYRALVTPLYSGRNVRAGLLFTDTPQLIELPPAKMDDALARLSQA